MHKKITPGFTLVELSIVLALISILSGVVFTGRGFIEQAKLSVALQQITTLRDAAYAYTKAQNGGATFEGVFPAFWFPPWGYGNLRNEGFIEELSEKNPWGITCIPRVWHNDKKLHVAIYVAQEHLDYLKEIAPDSWEAVTWSFIPMANLLCPDTIPANGGVFVAKFQ